MWGIICIVAINAFVLIGAILERRRDDYEHWKQKSKRLWKIKVYGRKEVRR